MCNPTLTEKPALVHQDDPSHEVCWAIQRLALSTRWRPSCLIQALAAQSMLARRRLPGEIQIGWKLEDSAFKAHAWVISQQKVILGHNEDVGTYQRICELPWSSRK